MIEFLKIVASLLGGGLAGAFFNEWLRRRRSGVQRIPLIERSNRRVSSELKGYALARTVNDSSGPKLEEVENLRDYQLTLRNSSPTHMKDAEVQFEFPADEVQAWASRPALSKTVLARVDATPSPPWKSAFRWRIPHLPSGDSVEFNFQAINPDSGKYEAALYHSDGVVLERVEGEPRLEQRRFLKGYFEWYFLTVGMGFLLLIAWALSGLLQEKSSNTRISLGGCDLQVSSSIKTQGVLFPWQGPWQLNYRIVNAGIQSCLIHSPKLMVTTQQIIQPGDVLEKETAAVARPKLVVVDILAGSPSTSLAKGTVSAYLEP